MSLVINTNSIATTAANNLHKNQTSLQKSLARLSSGSKLTKSSDDAGGLAVSTKLTAAINRNVRAQQNVSNSISYLQTQDGALKVAVGILDRISELKTMSLDPTKNAEDLATYNAEFKQLQAQLNNISKEKFNDIDLFNKFSSLKTYTTEDGETGQVTLSRGGLFDQLSESQLTEKAVTAAAFVGLGTGETSELTFATPTHGLSATIVLSGDDPTVGQANGSDISSAIKGINDALAAAGITTIKASEGTDSQLVISGNESFTIAETIGGGYAGTGLGADLAGTAQAYDGIAKSYDYNQLADYRVGDVVSGVRADGTRESYLITDSSTAATTLNAANDGSYGVTGVLGNGRTFDEFAALAETTRLNNSADPSAQVMIAADGAGTAIQYAAGEVVYDDSNGRYYLSRGDGTWGATLSTAAATAANKTEFLELGSSLPGLSDFDAFSADSKYSMDDIVSYDGSLYVATTAITNGEASPLDGGNWVKLNVAVSGTQSLLDMDNDLSDFSVADLRGFIQIGATSRAQNGAEMSRLEVSNEMLATNHANIEAANSNLADVDVATESTAFARANILVQSAAAMLAQANTSQSVALSLLQ